MAKINYAEYICTLLPTDEHQAFLSSYQTPLPKTIKVVTSKIALADFEKIVQDWGWEIEKTVHVDCFYIHKWTGAQTLGQHFLHQAGFYYIQELSASMSAPLLEAKPGELVLDMCAAPGGKSVQVADTRAFVVANEPLNPRRKALIYNLNRTGMINTAITNIDGSRFGDLYPEMFDKVLVDAPCSGEGMSYKTGGPLSRNEGLVQSLARTQIKLLASAIHTCKIGGTIVYSTCTLNDIENEQVIEKTLESFGSQITLEYSKKFWPHRDKTGGFFVAKIRRNHPNSIGVQTLQCNVSTPKNPLFDTSDKLQNSIKEKLSQDFGITVTPENYLFFSTLSTIYLTHTNYLSIHGKISIDKVGIPLYDIARDGKRIPNHHLGNIFAHLAQKNVFSCSDEQAQAYTQGKNILLGEENQNGGEGFFLLKRKKYGFSLAKKINDFLKNKML